MNEPTPSQPFSLDLADSVTLHGFLDLPDTPEPAPAVVISHGFKGFMEWGFFPHLAELLARRGFVAVRFNFSGSGMRPGEERVSDLEAFRRNTLSRELGELEAVLEALGGSLAPQRVDLSRIALFGHSRGGGTALLQSAREGWRHRLTALVTWASVADFHRFSDADIDHWRERGDLVIVNSRTGQELPLGLELLEDLERHRSELDLLAAARRRQAPWLIVHGAADETVPVEEGRRLAAQASSPKELEIVEDADHTFGVRHPFSGPSPALVRAMNATQLWLRRHLS